MVNLMTVELSAQVYHKEVYLALCFSYSLPACGKCTLANLLENYYKECSIDYNCPKCNRGGKQLHKIFI